MAYIPDEAIDDSDRVSPSAFRVYCLLCKRRSRETGLSFAATDQIGRSLALRRSQTYAAVRELQDVGWINKAGSKYQCVKGHFSPPTNRKFRLSEISDNQSVISDAESENSDSRIMHYQPLIPTVYSDEPRSTQCTMCNGTGEVYDVQFKKSFPCLSCEEKATDRIASDVAIS